MNICTVFKEMCFYKDLTWIKKKKDQKTVCIPAMTRSIHKKKIMNHKILRNKKTSLSLIIVLSKQAVA